MEQQPNFMKHLTDKLDAFATRDNYEGNPTALAFAQEIVEVTLLRRETTVEHMLMMLCASKTDFENGKLELPGATPEEVADAVFFLLKRVVITAMSMDGVLKSLQHDIRGSKDTEE